MATPLFGVMSGRVQQKMDSSGEEANFLLQALESAGLAFAVE